MRIAILTSDNRESFKTYTNEQPCMGMAPEALLQGFSNLPDVEIHVVSCLQQSVPVSEQLIDNIRYHALNVPKIGWLRTGYQGCIRAVRRKLKEIRPDIVHGQGTERDCAISAVFSGFPNVLTIHGNMKALADFFHAPPCSFHWLAAKLETIALKKTDGVFCNSAYTEKMVALRTQKTWRVPNALRLRFFEMPKSALHVEPPVLLNVGSVLPYKRQLEILALAHRLYQRGAKFEFHFVGEISPHQKYGMDFAIKLAVAEKIGYARHLGKLSLSQLILAMDTASALVHFPNEEAFGLVVAEALARNKKIFGAITGGITDIASNIDQTELFHAQDFVSLENSIEHWLATGCPQPQTAAVTMRNRFHPEIIARKHVEIYREVLARK